MSKYETPFDLSIEPWMYMSEAERQKHYGKQWAAEEVADALQNLLNGIRSQFKLVDIYPIADETWANALRRCDRALEAYRNGGQAND